MRKEFTAEQLALLAGIEFNSLLAKDEVLQQLEAKKYDDGMEMKVLLEVLSMNVYHIGLLPVMPLTAAKYSFLAALKSPFVHGGECTTADLDLALYVLSLPDLREMNCETHLLPAVSSSFATATGLEEGEVVEDVKELFSTAFHLLSLLPDQEKREEEKNMYDALWVTFLVSLAARESGMDFMYCMHKMSLSSVCALYINYCKRESSFADSIRRRLPEEVEKEVEARVDFLAEEYLKNV